MIGASRCLARIAELEITKSAPVGTLGSEEGEDGTQVTARSPKTVGAEQGQPPLALPKYAAAAGANRNEGETATRRG